MGERRNARERSYDIDPQFLFRCHRIALDFGPIAAHRALLRYEQALKPDIGAATSAPPPSAITQS